MFAQIRQLRIYCLQQYQRDRFDFRLWGVAVLAALVFPWIFVTRRDVTDMLCVLIGICFLIHSYRERQWQWTRDPALRIGVCAWVWLCLVVSPLAANPVASILGALPWVRFLLLYAALRHWLCSNETVLRLLAGSLLVLIALISADTLWQYMYGVSFFGHAIPEGGRLTGPMHHVRVGIYLTKMMVPLLAPLLYFTLRDSQWTLLGMGCFVCLLAAAAILLSGERTAFFSMVFAILAFGFLMVSRLPKIGMIYFSTLSLLVAGGLWLWQSQDWVRYRIDEMLFTLNDFGASPYGNLFIAGYEMGKEHWLLGVGLKGFRETCHTLIDQGVITYCNLHPHNLYLEWWAEAGAVGLALFVALVIALLREGFQQFYRGRGLALILPCGALATCVVHFFPFMVTQSAFINWGALLLWYSLALGMSGLSHVSAAKP